MHTDVHMTNRVGAIAPQVNTLHPLEPREQGMSEDEAAIRLAADGPNELPSAKPRSMGRMGMALLCEPMFALLLGCGAIYLLLGNRQEALMLLAFVLVVMAITFFQEHKAERALEALRSLASPRARVVRGGVQRTIPGRDVVAGDIVMVAEGDRVPADCLLLQSMNLAVDESLLTGESAPAAKRAATPADPDMGKPGGDGLPFIFSGTLVVQGKAIARAVHTGGDTTLGRIGKALAAAAPERTRIQRDTDRVVKRFAVVAFGTAALMALWYGATRADWLNGFLVGITFAMAILPEELPVVLTIFLGLGAWRLAQKNVLTRRVPAIEMLGAATVLCVDKTGTLTQNRMTLTRLAVGANAVDLAALPGGVLPETYHTLLEFSILASHRDPFDPMEKAIHASAQATLAKTEHLHGDWELVDEYPLSPELLAMSRVWRSAGLQAYVIAAKGAPEAIADLCHFDAASTAALDRQVLALAGQGLRVLAVARSSFARPALPPIQHDFEFEFLGLIGLSDPVRDGVPAAIATSQAAGIRVVMMTGDYQATAMRIATHIGLDTGGGYVTGQELDTLTDADLRRRVAGTSVFCRVAPEQKLRLVDALKANGEVVAMTGDGVNDAPALRAAHIGIAMGGRGTDVAREAAALVLLDDDFSSIVDAIRLGRRIFDNLRKAITFIVAVHVPIIGMSLAPVALGWPLALMPVHILFLQLTIDPACSIVFEAEPEEDGIMQRPPRSPVASLFDRATMSRGLLEGGMLLAIVLTMYGMGLYLGQDPGQARALTFATMVLANVSLIFASRSRAATPAATPNRARWWTSGASLLFLGLALYVPPLRGLFHFSLLHWHDLALCLLASGLFLAAVETLGRVHPRRMGRLLPG